MADPPVYELVDSNGNVVGELNQEVANNLLRLSNEQTNTEIQIKDGEVDYQNNDISNLGALSADEATIGNSTAAVVGSDSRSGDTTNTVSLSVSGIPREDDPVYVVLDINPRDSGAIEMQIIGNTSGYFYFDETGTQVGPRGEWEIVSFNAAFGEASGRVKIETNATNNRPTIHNQAALARMGIQSGYLTFGGLDASIGDPYSVTITSTGGMSDGDEIVVRQGLE